MNYETEVLTKPKTIKRTSYKKVPDELIYEVYEGKPVYYKNYESVLKNKSAISEIMASSSLQSLIVQCIIEYFIESGIKVNYKILAHELGLHIDRNNNLGADIAIYEKKWIENYLFSDKYIDIPPKIVIEVDTKADLTNFDGTWDYFQAKTNKLFEFGVEKVFWVLTKTKIVIGARPNESWTVTNWNLKVHLMDDIYFSINELLDKENIKYNK